MDPVREQLEAMKFPEAKARGSRRPRWWWTTVKGGRRSSRKPWRWLDPRPRPVKIRETQYGYG